MLRHNPECPSWPQLPQADFREGMYIQYAEGMPAVIVEAGERRVYFDTDRAPEELAAFYESYLAGSLDRCGISDDYARSFELFVGRMPSAGARFIKGQVTGPCSFGLTVNDREGKPVLYQEDLFEAVVKALACKGRWQVERFRQVAPDPMPIIFFDEPYLTQVGSAMISLSPKQVVANLDECFSAIDGLTGIHVCGGTDWGLLTTTAVDILHFDAADHSQEFLLYEKDIASFLERGGLLAWGIVPTDDRARDLKSGEQAGRIEMLAAKIAGFGPGSMSTDDVLRRSFISESCGAGTLDPALTERCFSLAGEISQTLKNKVS